MRISNEISTDACYLCMYINIKIKFLRSKFLDLEKMAQPSCSLRLSGEQEAEKRMYIFLVPQPSLDPRSPTYRTAASYT